MAARVLGADPNGSVGRRFGSITRVQEIGEALGQTIRTGVQRQREILLPAHPKDRILEVHQIELLVR